VVEAREHRQATSGYSQRVPGCHDDAEDPAVLRAHVVDASEVRTVDELADGRLARPVGERESGSTRRGAAPVPPPEKNPADRQFVFEVVDDFAFEQVWLRARGGV
jgi:hypothetical protein